MSTVLSRIDQSAGARADFEVGVVQITSGEYETALSVAADGAKSNDDDVPRAGPERLAQPTCVGRFSLRDGTQ